MEVEAHRRLVSKPRTTASVWKHFEFEPDEKGKPKNPDRPTCRTCYLEVSAKDGNTTNKALDIKKYVGVVYLNISKAFDTVHYNLLLSKLSHLGLSLSTVSQFKSYLL